MTLEQLQQEIKEAVFKYPELLYDEILVNNISTDLPEFCNIDSTEIIGDSSKTFIIKIY